MTGGTVSFTASRLPVGEDEHRPGLVTSILAVNVPHAARYVTGGCTGGDAFIGRWLRRHRTDANEHVVIVPADRSRVEEWWAGLDGVTVTEMPPGTTYADRNARLVAEADAVFGFPAYPEHDSRSARSGTWQTIRMARKAGKFSQYHCVQQPYQGRIEAWPRDLIAASMGLPGCSSSVAGLAHNQEVAGSNPVPGTNMRLVTVLRRPGSPRRILVHEWLGAKAPGGIRYGRSYDVSNDPSAPAREAERTRRLNAMRPGLPPLPEEYETRHTVLEGTEFDELVIGRWVHLEQQDAGTWWMSAGGVVVSVTADRDGRPRRVDVFGPGDYDGRAEDCEYSITWTGPENGPRLAAGGRPAGTHGARTRVPARPVPSRHSPVNENSVYQHVHGFPAWRDSARQVPYHTANAVWE